MVRANILFKTVLLRIVSPPPPPLQAAVIRQDSILELCPREGLASSAPPTPTPAPAPHHPVAKLNRSMSRDTGLDAGTAAVAIDDAAMLQRQNAFLQDELVRLRPLEARLRESERARALLDRKSVG